MKTQRAPLFQPRGRCRRRETEGVSSTEGQSSSSLFLLCSTLSLCLSLSLRVPSFAMRCGCTHDRHAAASPPVPSPLPNGFQAKNSRTPQRQCVCVCLCLYDFFFVWANGIGTPVLRCGRSSFSFFLCICLWPRSRYCPRHCLAVPSSPSLSYSLPLPPLLFFCFFVWMYS